MKPSLLIPLILFAALLTWTLMTPRENLLHPAPPPSGAKQRIPTSYATGVTTFEFDEQGVLTSRMEATALRRYRGSSLVELDMPIRENFGEAGTWTASAQRGLLKENTETLRLDGSVRLHYDSEGAQFLSESMLINIPRRTARSLAPVEAWTGENRIGAPNMFISLDSQRATLRGGVTSTYAPSR
jgi:LPS export ABC transporter protein LptC